MKKLIYFTWILFFLTGCYPENKGFDNTVMPEETTEGANTFACLIDGWIYSAGRYLYKWNREYYKKEAAYLFLYNPETNNMEVKALVRKDIWIEFTIINPEEGKKATYTDASFDYEKLEDGTVYITRFDPETQIISGTFEGGRMTHGRFDVIYVIQED